jgi:hypothetical protein
MQRPLQLHWSSKIGRLRFLHGEILVEAHSALAHIRFDAAGGLSIIASRAGRY